VWREKGRLHRRGLKRITVGEKGASIDEEGLRGGLWERRGVYTEDG
jgi:hypothetical protein